MKDTEGLLVCDRCGGPVYGGGVTEAVSVTLLDDNNQVQTLLYCLTKDDQHDGCATRIFTAKATAHRQTQVEDKVSFYQATYPGGADG